MIKTNSISHNYIAIAYMLAASGLLAATGLLAKALGRGVLGPALHPLQISHGRFLFAFIALLLAAAILRPRITKLHLGLHVARTTCGWAGISLMFAAIAYIPLPDATAISFLNPVFAMMFAIPVLGERVGNIRWSAAAVAVFGALVLLRPTGDSFQPAALLAVASAFIMGFEIVLIKLLAGRQPPLQVLLTNNTIGLIIASTAVVFVWKTPEPTQWAGLAALGFLMALAQTCFIQSMRHADASFVVPFSYTTLVFAAFYDFAVFDAIPDRVSVLGATIIIAGAAILAWREARQKSAS